MFSFCRISKAARSFDFEIFADFRAFIAPS